MHDDAEDHATLKRHYDRLEALYADLLRSQSRGDDRSDAGVCAAVRRVDNPRYRYAVEQIVWIKGPLGSSPRNSLTQRRSDGTFVSGLYHTDVDAKSVRL